MNILGSFNTLTRIQSLARSLVTTTRDDCNWHFLAHFQNPILELNFTLYFKFVNIIVETGGLVDFFLLQNRFKKSNEKPWKTHPFWSWFNTSNLRFYGTFKQKRRYGEVCCAWLNVLYNFFPAGFAAFLLKTTPPVLGKEFWIPHFFNTPCMGRFLSFFWKATW